MIWRISTFKPLEAVLYKDSDNQFEFRAQPDWAFEFPDRTGHPNLPDRSCWAGLNPDLYSAYTSFIGNYRQLAVMLYKGSVRVL